MIRPFSEIMKEKISTDRNPVMTLISDKIRVKEYVDKRVPGNNLFKHRIYAGYDLDEAIEKIKPPCVMRINNAWHRMVFIRDKNFNKKEIAKKFRPWFGSPHNSWEWAYRDIIPGITIEDMLPDVHDLCKLFVFGGVVKFIWIQRYDISSGAIGLIGATLYDREFKHIDAQWNDAPQPDFRKPARLDELIKISEALSHETKKKISEFCRVDLYYNYENDKILFSEMTHYHAGGTNGFAPPDIDYLLGAQWPEK